jgi:hypothetical protein
VAVTSASAVTVATAGRSESHHVPAAAAADAHHQLGEASAAAHPDDAGEAPSPAAHLHDIAAAPSVEAAAAPSAAAHDHATGECQPTPAQQAAADRLVAETRRGTARFASLASAEADDYRPVTPPSAPTVHYINPEYADDGRVLDPEHPEVLVYANTRRGPVLTGAMYLANQPGDEGPAVGGCLTAWHTHTDLCFSTSELQVVSFSSDGSCPAGQVHYVPPPMLHVWLVDVPGGPFAGSVDGSALVRRLDRG